MIPIAFRFDDPSPVSDRSLEEGIFACFVRHRIPLTIAVIPFHRTETALMPLLSEHVLRLTGLARAGLVEVALHGYTHQELHRTPGGHPSEFWGVPLSTQRDLLRLGRQQLGAAIEMLPMGFVPPWNTFDENTVSAARAEGFEYVSAARQLPDAADADFALVPISCNVSHVRQAVSEAERFGPFRPVIVPILHHYDFRESGAENARSDLGELDRMLEWLSVQRGLEPLKLSELARRVPAAGWRRGAKRWRIRERLHWRVRERLPGYCLLTGSILGSFRPAQP